ncbi:hypothetical protein TEA_001163 [Camellia sinensis var. sinensis]|uniref:Uncharacterized protein n=1 Tax=Camellia sinensis var. sinensis TaxID=542762 RepID=A0A4S4D7V9_CAMSN|nr:hypothetical protein TEA_001163 [Camellia sinensis var. sinensis]
MASTLIITMAKPFTSHSTNLPSLSNQRLLGGRRDSLRVSAIAKKFEPTKVIPQADRVLIRLEELPEKSAGGVLLPKSAVKFERYLMGEILSIGAEVEQVEAGKKVLFSDVSAYEVGAGIVMPNVILLIALVNGGNLLTRWIWEQMEGTAFVKLVICWPWLSKDVDVDVDVQPL